jgi:hypothetical protein
VKSSSPLLLLVLLTGSCTPCRCFVVKGVLALLVSCLQGDLGSVLGAWCVWFHATVL